ncbi:hypothetical protein [Fulvitalea axinellae]
MGRASGLRYGGFATSTPTDMVRTRDGGIVMSGNYEGGPFEIGNIMYRVGFFVFQGFGATDGYVVKFNNQGTAIWATTIGGSGRDGITAIDTDSLGNVYITGSYRNTGIFNPFANEHNFAEAGMTSAGGSDIFITKYSPQGDFLWAKGFGGPMDDKPYDLIVDDAGNIILFSEFYGRVDFDPSSETQNFSYADIAAAQVANFRSTAITAYNKDGEYLWGTDSHIKALTGGQLSFASDGDVLLGGHRDIQSFSAIRFNCIFKIGSDNGSTRWRKYIYSENQITQFYVTDMHTASDGLIYLTGRFNGKANFVPNGSPRHDVTATQQAMYLASYDQNGEFRWVVAGQSSTSAAGKGLAPASGGDVYWYSDFMGNLTVTPLVGDSFSYDMGGDGSAIMSRLGSDGSVVSHSMISSTEIVSANRVVTDDQDEVFLSGDFRGTLVFGDDVLEPIRAHNAVYLAHYENCENAVHMASEADICQGDSALVFGRYRQEAGVYRDTVRSLLSCDTVKSFELRVRPNVNRSAVATFCSGDSVLFAGQYVKTGGVFQDVATTVFGCDSINILTVDLHARAFKQVEMNLCENDSLLFGGEYIKESGFYIDTLVTEQGCDSVIQLNLNMLDRLEHRISMEVCSGESVFFAGAQRNQTGTYFNNLVSEDGCDSTVVLDLTVGETLRSRQQYTICRGDSVLIADRYFKTSQTFDLDLTASSGCDSIVTVDIRVNNTDTIPVSRSICDGDSLLFGRRYLRRSGVYYHLLSQGNECDSVEMLQLTVEPIRFTRRQASICSGDSLLINGTYRKDAGAYLQRSITESGCSSVTQFEISVIPPSDTLITRTICEGSSYFFNGAYRVDPGIYQQTFLSSRSCDSLVTLDLRVLNYVDTIRLGVCFGDSAFVAGAYRHESGLYYDSLVSSFGCDSVMVTDFTVGERAASRRDMSICSGDSVLLGGEYRKSSGTFADMLTATSGCDSVVTTNLTVLPIRRTSVDSLICSGDRVLFGERYYSNSGVYTDTVRDASGCLRINTLNLTVPDRYFFNNSMMICAGDSIRIGGLFRKTAGTYYDSLLTQSGCDSVMAIDVMVAPEYEFRFEKAIPLGDSMLLGGEYRKESGEYYDSLLTDRGCDSVLITTLRVLPPEMTLRRINICNGDSLEVQSAFRKTQGLYYDTLEASTGADSIIATELGILEKYYSEVSMFLGKGESVVFGGEERTQTGIYYDSLTAVNGCDSVKGLRLTVYPYFFESEDVTICQGDRYFLVSQGVYRTRPGVFRDSLFNADTLYSIRTTNLGVAPVFMSEKSVSLKRGDSVRVHGRWRSESGVFMDTLVSRRTGCDSILMVRVNVVEPYYRQKNFSICEGESVEILGRQRSVAGHYIDTIRSSPVRDTISVNILEVRNVGVLTRTISLCEGDSAFVMGRYLQPGITTDTLIASSGCDSLVITNIVSRQHENVMRNLTLCAGDSVLLQGAYRREGGMYIDSFVSNLSCDSLVFTDLSVQQIPVRQIEREICQGDSILIAGVYRHESGVFTEEESLGSGCDGVLETTLSVVGSGDDILDTGQIADEDLCLVDSPIVLPAPQEAIGLSYSGTGVTGFRFDPVSAGAGVHTVSYSYRKSGEMCSVSGSFDIGVVACLDVVRQKPVVHIFPNPTKRWVSIRFSAGGRYDIGLFDSFGRKVGLLANDKMIRKGELLRFDGKHIASGTYMLIVESEHLVQEYRVILY